MQLRARSSTEPGPKPRPVFRAAALLLCAFLALLTLIPSARARRKSTDDFDYDDARASPTPTPPKFNIPIPVGHDAEGVNLPYFDNRGRLQMYFVIARAFREDLYHLDLDDAYMQSYDDKGAPDATVYMTHSILDLNTRIVTSQVPVTVRRSDFEIVGQNMVFNTQTRQGRMTGHVRMTIYNRQDMSNASPSPTPYPRAAGAAASP
jgi:hypothetical protein